MADVIPKLVDYRMPTPLFSRYFTHSETSSDSGNSARLYRLFTDGSEQKHIVESEVNIAETEAKMSFKHADDCNILLAEI